MDTKQFLTAVLSDEGHYCTVGIKNGHPKFKFYNSIDSLIDTAQNFDVEGHDAYFALATFKDPKNGRKAANVNKMKSLFLDIDCGEGKTYKTQRIALGALYEFYSKYNLDEPAIVVSSGNGLHVYWVLDKSYDKDEWQLVAEQLKNACIKDGFDADHVVTADSARILRVPGTHNFKSSPPLSTSILLSLDKRVSLADFASKLPKINVEKTPSLQSRNFSEQDKADMLAATGNKSYKLANMFAKIVAGSGCAQIKHALDNPNEITYGQWLHVLSIAKFCEEEHAIHAVSSKYKDYSFEETESVAAGIDTPHLCITFEKDNPTKCEGCPYKNKIRTPISLCGEFKEATAKDNIVEVPIKPITVTNTAEYAPVEVEPDESQDSILIAPTTRTYHIPPYPRPYARGANGGVFLLTKNKDGDPEEIQIHDNDLYLMQRLRDPIDGPCYLVRHHTKREGVHDFVSPSVKLSSPEEFRKEMCNNDIFVRAKSAERLMGYMEAWIKELQKTQDEIHVRTQFGWTENCESFVVGDREIFAHTVKPNPPGARTAQYFPAFKKRGTLEEWKKIPTYFNRPNFGVHQYMFGLSFGSPLMQFVPGIHGVTYNLTSADSGYGKTGGQKAGASVWGDPEKLVVQGQDTHYSLFLRAEIYKNIVLYVDEMSNIEGKQASDFSYGVSSGEQRNRLTNSGQNKERYRGETWSLLVGASGNSSIIERASRHRASPKGELGRVVNNEATLLLTGTEDTKRGYALRQLMLENFGHAGELYIQHVIANKDEIKRSVRKMLEHIDRDAGLTPQHRYWCAQAATTYVGVEEAKKIGLLDWNTNEFYWWIINMLKNQKENSVELDMGITDIVREYYSDNINQFLRIKSTNSGLVVPDLENVYQSPDAMPHNKWVGRHEYDINKLYILPGPFKAWCLQKNYHWNSIRNRILTEMGGRSTRVRLGSGTKIDIGTSYVLEVSLDVDE